MVGKILCLGQNYAAHAKEMKADTPTVPVVFLKPSTALLDSGGTVRLPVMSRDVHHEVEMVIVIGKSGSRIDTHQAMDVVAGYAVGLDMTMRDVQADAKKRGHPWAVAKGFDTSAPLSPAVPKDLIADPHTLDISLRVNGSIRQSSNTGLMLFRVPDIIAYLSSVFTLEEGDLIFTGTPEGVGPVRPGDILEATLQSVGSLKVKVE
jgi:2-keto-4-pentenoate hydratase/2-oxohepta-3-ene-1,7-dioic acid hydratase in catechol pathway